MATARDNLFPWGIPPSEIGNKHIAVGDQGKERRLLVQDRKRRHTAGRNNVQRPSPQAHADPPGRKPTDTRNQGLLVRRKSKKLAGRKDERIYHHILTFAL